MTSIGDEAFWECTGLTSLIIPNSLNIIDRRAFYRCSSLTSIIIPSSVTTINRAFEECNNLTSVTTGISNPISIESYTFTNRTNATLYVPKGTKAAYEAADYWKEFKEIIEIGGDVEPDVAEIDGIIWRYTVEKGEATIVGCDVSEYLYNLQMQLYDQWGEQPDPEDEMAYQEWAMQTNLGAHPEYLTFAIPNELGGYPVTAIGDGAFRDQIGGIMYVDFSGTSVTSIGDEAFYECGLYGVNFPNTLVTIGDRAFYNCMMLGEKYISGYENPTMIDDVTGIWTLSFPESIQQIGNQAFEGCSLFKGINFEGNNLVSIGDAAFKDCFHSGNFVIEDDFSLNLPESTQQIGEGAFENTPFWHVSLGNSLTAIGDNAFKDCENLGSVAVGNVNPIAISSTVFPNRIYETLYVPKGSKAAYKAADYWKEFKRILEIGDDDSPYMAGNELTEGYLRYVINDDLTTVTVVGYTDDIPEDIVIPNTIHDGEFTVNAIASYSFANCFTAQSLVLPETIENIETEAFIDCGFETIRSYINPPFDIMPSFSGEMIFQGVFSEYVQQTCLLYEPKGTKDLYSSAEG